MLLCDRPTQYLRRFYPNIQILSVLWKMIYKEEISITKADWGGIVYPIRLLYGTETELIRKCIFGTV
jgi:hypothetical protein